MWNASEMVDTDPPSFIDKQHGLWELGNEVIAGV
jgi:hypothetical protein